MNKKHTKKIALSLAIAVGSTNCLASVSAADTPIQGNELIDLGTGENANISTDSAIDLPSETLITTEAALSIEPKMTVGGNTSNVTITEGMERPLVAVTITSSSQDIETLLNEAQVSKDVEIDLTIQTEEDIVFKFADLQKLTEYSIVNLDMSLCYDIESGGGDINPFKKCIKNVNLNKKQNTHTTVMTLDFEDGTHLENLIIPDYIRLDISHKNEDRSSLIIDKISFGTVLGILPYKGNAITLENLILGNLDLSQSKDTMLFFTGITYLSDFEIPEVKYLSSGVERYMYSGTYQNCVFKGNVEILANAILSWDTADNTIEGDCVLRGERKNYSLNRETVLGTVKVKDNPELSPWMFQECNLNNIELLEGIKEIQSYVFSGTAIKNITLPDSVTTIQDRAFEYTDIDHVNNLENIITIGRDSFYGSKIKSIVIGKQPNTTVDSGAFRGCKELKNVTLLNGITVLERGLFQESGVEEITIPSYIKEIKSECFKDAMLKEVTFEHGSEDPLSIGWAAFVGNQIGGRLTIPDSVKEIASYSFAHNRITEVILPSSLKVIEDSVFQNNKINKINLSPTITEIKSSAFANNELTNIDFQQLNNCVFGSNVFENNLLEGVVDLTGITEIPNEMFKNNKYITEVIAPNVRTTGESSFENCTSLSKITYPKKQENYFMGKRAFYNCALDLSLGENNETLKTYVNDVLSVANYQIPYVTYQAISNIVSSGMRIKDVIDVTTLNGMPIENLLRTSWYDNSQYAKQMQYKVYELVEGQKTEKSSSDTLMKGKHVFSIEPIEGVKGVSKIIEIEVESTGMTVKPITTIYDKAEPLDLKKMVRVFINGSDITSLDIVKVNTDLNLNELQLGNHEIPVTVIYKNQSVTTTVKVTVVDSRLESGGVDNLTPEVKPLPSNYEVLSQSPIFTNMSESRYLYEVVRVKKDGSLVAGQELFTLVSKIEDTISGRNLTEENISKFSELSAGSYNLKYTLKTDEGECTIEIPVTITFNKDSVKIKELPQYWYFAKNKDVLGTKLDIGVECRTNTKQVFTDYTGEDLKITLNQSISNLPISQNNTFEYVSVKVEIPSYGYSNNYVIPAKIVQDVKDAIFIESIPFIVPTKEEINLDNLSIYYNGKNIRELCNVTLLTDPSVLVDNKMNDVQYHVICEQYGVDKVIDGKMIIGNISLPTEAVSFEYKTGSTLQQQLEAAYPNGLPTDLTIKGSGSVTLADMNYLGKQKIKRLDLSMANTNLGGLNTISFKDNTFIEEFINFKNRTVNIDSYQFSGCINLRKIDLGLASMIDTRAFENCINLNEVINTEKLWNISDRAFENCKTLKSLTLGTANTTTSLEIGKFAFMNSGLENFEIKGYRQCSLTSSFYNAINLNGFKTDSGVYLTIKDDAFKNTRLTGDLNLNIEKLENSSFEGLKLENVIIKTKSNNRVGIYSGFKNCHINLLQIKGDFASIYNTLLDNCTIGTFNLLEGSVGNNSTMEFASGSDVIVKNTTIDNFIVDTITLSTSKSYRCFENSTIKNTVFEHSILDLDSTGGFFYKCKGFSSMDLKIGISDSGAHRTVSFFNVFVECLDLKELTMTFEPEIIDSSSISLLLKELAKGCPNLIKFEMINKPEHLDSIIYNKLMVNCGYLPNMEVLKSYFTLQTFEDMNDYFEKLIPTVVLNGNQIVEVYENDIIPFNLLVPLTTEDGKTYNSLLSEKWYDVKTHKERTSLDFEIVNKKTRQKADYTKILPVGEYLVSAKLLNDANSIPVTSTLIVKPASDLCAEGRDLVVVEGEVVNLTDLYTATLGNSEVTNDCSAEILNDIDLTNLTIGTHEVNLLVNYNGYSDVTTSSINVLKKQGEVSIKGNVIAPSANLEIRINNVLSNKNSIDKLIFIPQDVVINIVDKNNIYKPTEIIVPVTLDQIKANEQIQLADIVLEQHALELTTKQVTVLNKAQVITASDFFEYLKSNGMILIPKDLIYKVMDNGTEVSLKEALQSNKTYEVILTATSDVRSVSATTQLVVNVPAEKPDDSEPPVVKPDDPKPPVTNPDVPKPPVTEPNEPEIPIIKPSTSTTVQKVIDNFPYTLPKGYDLKHLLNGIKVLKGDVDTFGIKNFKVEKNGAVGTFDVLSDNLGEDIPKLPFTDTLKHWAGEDIEKARVLGIVKGSETDLFKPNRAVTISESLAILDRVFLSNGMVAMTSTRSTVEYALPSKEMWYYFNAGSILSKMDRQEVTKANNLIKGNYSRAITRGELALILSQICDTLPTVNTQKYVFTDTYNSPYNVALQDCWAKGLLVGKSSTKMAPKDTLTRAELTVIALRLHNLYK